MKTLKEWLKNADEKEINLLIDYNILKKQEDGYVPVFTPFEELTLEKYKELEKTTEGIISKDDGNSVVYIPWEKKEGSVIIATRRLEGFKHSI